MENNNLITDKLNEKVYSANSGDSKENITEILYCFLDELVKRKRKQSLRRGYPGRLKRDRFRQGGGSAV